MGNTWQSANQPALCEAVRALIREASLVKFSVIKIQPLNCLALTSDFRMGVPEKAEDKTSW